MEGGRQREVQKGNGESASSSKEDNMAREANLSTCKGMKYSCKGMKDLEEKKPCDVWI